MKIAFVEGTHISTIVKKLGKDKTITVLSGSYGSKIGLTAITTAHHSDYKESSWLLSLLFDDNTTQEFTATEKDFRCDTSITEIFLIELED